MVFRRKEMIREAVAVHETTMRSGLMGGGAGCGHIFSVLALSCGQMPSRAI